MQTKTNQGIKPEVLQTGLVPQVFAKYLPDIASDFYSELVQDDKTLRVCQLRIYRKATDGQPDQALPFVISQYYENGVLMFGLEGPNFAKAWRKKADAYWWLAKLLCNFVNHEWHDRNGEAQAARQHAVNDIQVVEAIASPQLPPALADAHASDEEARKVRAEGAKARKSKTAQALS